MVERRPHGVAIIDGKAKFSPHHQVSSHFRAVAYRRAFGQTGGATGVKDKQRIFGFRNIELGVQRHGTRDPCLVGIIEHNRLGGATLGRVQ